MWWREENDFPRDGGHRRRTLFHTSLPHADHSPTPVEAYGGISKPLTKAEEEANQRLLESEAGEIRQVKTLLADIAKLEAAVREQVTKRVALESNAQQQTELQEQKLADTVGQLQESLVAERSSREQETQRLAECIRGLEQKCSNQRAEHKLATDRLAECEREKADQGVEADRLRERLAVSEEQRAEYVHQNELLQARLVAARQTVAQRDRTIASEQKQLDQTRQQLAAVEAKLGANGQQLSKAEARIETEKQKLSDALRDAQQDHAAETRRLRAIASSAESLSRKRQGLIAALESENSGLEEAHISSLEEVREANALKLRTMDESLADLSDQLRSRNSEITNLSAERAALTEANVSLRTENERQRTECETLRREVDALRTEAETQHADADAHRREADSLRREADSLRTEADSLRASTQSQQVEIDSLRMENDSNRRQSASKQDDFETLTQVNEDLRVTNEKIGVEVDALRSANTSLVNQVELANAELETARAELERNSQQHTAELRGLNAELGQLRSELEQASVEREAAKQEQSQLESERVAAIVQLESELTVAKNDARRFSVCAVELQTQCDDLQAAVEDRTREAAESKSQHQAEFTKLRASLERAQDDLVHQTRLAGEVETELRQQCDSLRSAIDEIRRESEQAVAESVTKSDSLKTVIAELESELDSRTEALNSKQSQLKKAEEALLRARSKSERLLELHQSQFATNQSRIDELIVQVETEREKRVTAESEARRLSESRSQRISFLAQQRESLQEQNRQLLERKVQMEKAASFTTGQLERLRDELSAAQEDRQRLENAVEAANQAVEAHKKLLCIRTDEIELLRQELLELDQQESQRVQSRLNRQCESNRERERLTESLAEARRELEACRKKLAESPREVLRDNESEPVEFAVVQRDRMIALLEQEALVMQERLQREAASRRKAESAVRRKARSTSSDRSMHRAWSEIEESEQVHRLRRQITALKNLSLLERQRFAAELSRHRKCIERLQQQIPKRAA